MRFSCVTVVTTVVSIDRSAVVATGASRTAVDSAVETVVEALEAAVESTRPEDVAEDTTVETLTAAELAVLWSTVAVESTALSDSAEDVAVLSWVDSEVRWPAAFVPIAIDRVELANVVVDRAALSTSVLDEARLTLVDRTTLPLSARDRSGTVADSDPEVLRKLLTALETWAEVGEAASKVKVDSVADSDTLVLVTRLRSPVTLLRFVLRAR